MAEKEKLFTPYQVFVIAILSILQFSVILDFMVLSPLGAILLPTLNITTSQFGLVVSAYAFSAGASGLLAAGFADKFDRKKMLLFFYVGFLGGTIFCALATTYEMLLAARIVTGIFGGVIGSIGFAIVTDMFRFEVRGRVMGFLQMSFAASQILGLPIGVFLATRYNWHAPFWLIVIFGSLVAVLIAVKLKPINEHLKVKSDRNPFQHLAKVISTSDYLKTFICTTLLATGGFMMMPFGSAFSTNNLGISIDDLWILYTVTGVFSIATGPLIGKLADKTGKFNVFVWGTILSCVTVAIYTPLGVTPFWIICAISVVMFIGISSRMISSGALVSGIPAAPDRGAFMAINSSVQQVSGGIAAWIGGKIIVQNTNGMIEHYDRLGYVVIGSMVVTIALMYWVDRHVKEKGVQSPSAQKQAA